MKSLASSTLYYRFGDDSDGNMSEERRFQVPPLPGSIPPTRPTTAVLFSDLGILLVKFIGLVSLSLFIIIRSWRY